MRRVLILVLVGIFIASCATLGVRTEGTSGPIAWYVTDLKSESSPVPRGTIGNPSGRYSLTLVLKETQGIPITFTYRKDTQYAVNIRILRSVDQAINLKLKPSEERRFPLTFTWGCSAGNCMQADNVAPRWTINLTGTDDKGNAVTAVINMNLPSNPDTYRKP